ncbi:histidinol-phosphate transaminase [Paenibacillus solisilvae]|uniref:Histidinol-phosphate aminotransferase n=1 Tax=Paenibacillus solisilvae TaxID=2486751 RepID=A0ABW0VZB0_9BACL
MSQMKIEAREVLQSMKPYSPGKPIWELQRELGLEKVIKLASNENPLGPSPKALAAIASAMAELHRYPDAQTTDLRKVIADNYHLSSEQIIVTNGGDELITLVSEAYLDAGDEIIVPQPSFSEYEFGGQLMGAVVTAVPLGESYQYEVREIIHAVTERTKIVYLCSPNNPTGTLLLKSELQYILDALPKHVLVVLDSAYSHYVESDDYTDGIEFVNAGYPVLVLHTFSKIYGLAGIRVGFGAASEEIIRSILQVKEPFNVNALAQAAAAAAIGDDEHILQSRQLVLEERQRLYGFFRELGLAYTESMSNFILLELGSEAELIYRKLMEDGVIVRYGGIWGLSRHVRISIGTLAENDILIKSLQKILPAVK